MNEIKGQQLHVKIGASQAWRRFKGLGYLTGLLFVGGCLFSVGLTLAIGLSEAFASMLPNQP